MQDTLSQSLTRKVALGLLLGGLFILAYVVMQHFIVPLAWAAIFAYTTWPLYRLLQTDVRLSSGFASLLMTLLITALLVVPTVVTAALLQGEMVRLFQAVMAYLQRGDFQLSPMIAQIPWLGPWLQEVLGQLTQDPQLLRQPLGRFLGSNGPNILLFVGGIGRNFAKLGLALVSLFFFYRHGQALFEQIRRVLYGVLGNRVQDYLDAAGATTRAVVFGLLLTALAQGVLAGLGYWVVGMTQPLLLTAVTTLVALIPFGTPFAWGGVVIWLLANGYMTEGLGLLAWGVFVVSWIDNLIRPMVISSATRMPFLLVFLGVLGGLAAFGLIGLFVGPVILAIALAVWREWLEEPAQAGVV